MIQLFCIFFFADLAQLVEQRIRNAKIEGSSPLIGTMYDKEYNSHRKINRLKIDFCCFLLQKMLLLELSIWVVYWM